MAQDFTEKQLNSRLVYGGKMLEVREDEVKLPSGADSTREYVVHPGASVIVPMFEDGTVLVERQYRYPVREHMLELPAGKIDQKEDPERAARRELLEETGYEAGRWDFIGTLMPCIGYSDELIHAYLARNLTYSKQNLDDEEFLETSKVSMNVLLQQSLNAQIQDAKTIIALLWTEQFLKKSA
jgi:ADP-ribose pyrophosphatase